MEDGPSSCRASPCGSTYCEVNDGHLDSLKYDWIA